MGQVYKADGSKHSHPRARDRVPGLRATDWLCGVDTLWDVRRLNPQDAPVTHNSLLCPALPCPAGPPLEQLSKVLIWVCPTPPHSYSQPCPSLHPKWQPS